MYLTLIHDGFGSMVEASEARAVLGPYTDATTADSAGALFTVNVSPGLRDDVWWTIVEIPTTATDPVQLAKEYDEELQ